jgi:hypothetical protein
LGVHHNSTAAIVSADSATPPSARWTWSASTVFGASEPTLRGSYGRIAIAHEFKLHVHVVGGVLTRRVSQAMGYSRSMFLKMCPSRDPFFSCSRRNCTDAGQKGSKMARAH